MTVQVKIVYENGMVDMYSTDADYDQVRESANEAAKQAKTRVVRVAYAEQSRYQNNRR